MARRYDSRTTIFSPEGRLYQVEYAMESVSHAGCVIGILAPGKIQSEALKKADAKIETSTVIEGVQTSPIVPTKPLEEDTPMLDATIVAPTASTSQTTTTATTKDEEIATEKGEEEKPKRAGIVLAAEKRVTSKLLDKDAGGGREKILSINNNILAGVAGMTADANSLVSFARNAAQGHLSTFNEDMPVEQLVRRVCDLKQGYTQYGGLRPFGVSFLFAGHDPHYQFQLYASDPSGNYRLVSLPYMLISSGADQVNETNSGWKATCIGANNSTASSLLRQDYKDDIGLDDALGLAVKVLSKTMDSTTLDSEKVEIATLLIDSKTNLPYAHVLSSLEVDNLLKLHGVAKKEEEER